MKRLLLNLGLLCFLSSALAQSPNITEMEYFLDVDPGFGSGTSITVTAANSQEIDLTIVTSGLDPGFHTLWVRAKDENGVWSHVESLPFFIGNSTTENQISISAAEYFLDIDPGHGNGTDLGITAGTQIDIMSHISTASLDAGFHDLYVRVRDAADQWSTTERLPFFISETTSQVQTNITAVEYFLGADPGYGNGTPVSITSAMEIDITELISTAALESGFHTLNFRVQDETGQWSGIEHEPFFISETTSQVQTNITAVEYFIGTDPGYGNGTSVSITSAVEIDIMELVPTASLESGFHVLSFRVQDETGQWSGIEREPFFISETTSQVQTNITAVEYFFGADPGHGNGTSVSITSATEIDLLELIPTAALESGFHVLNFRVQDEIGQWSAIEQEPFFISETTSQVQTNITAVEYFIGADPGHGNGTSVSITSAMQIDLTELIPTASLESGFHVLNFRVQDETGLWSAIEREPFFISQTTSQVQTNITAVEYFFGADPGQGNGTMLSFTPATEIDLFEMISTASLEPGFHTLSFRVQDANEQWSQVENQTIFH